MIRESIHDAQGPSGVPAVIDAEFAPTPRAELPVAVEPKTPLSGLLRALELAGTLKLSGDEIARLRAPFPESAVRTKPAGGRQVSYLPHTDIRRRLTDVLGTSWTMVRLREWYDQDSGIAYGAFVLIVRGVWVADTVAGHPWHGNNPNQDMSDALEAAASTAIRRMAAKSCLGCGDQVWPHDEGEVMKDTVQQQRETTAQQKKQDNELMQLVVSNAKSMLKSAASCGTPMLEAAWQGIGKELRTRVGAPFLATCKAIAAERDAKGPPKKEGEL